MRVRLRYGDAAAFFHGTVCLVVLHEHSEGHESSKQRAWASITWNRKGDQCHNKRGVMVWNGCRMYLPI